MKKIKKVWPAYLKTNPDGDEVKKARKYIAEPYKDFHDAYSHGVEMLKYEDWKVDWLIETLDCTIWDLFEDVREPTKEDYRKMEEEDLRIIEKLSKDGKLENPSRYVGKSGMQVFDVINEFGLDFYEGNALKYLIRYKKKNGLEDLKKCRDYLDYMIAGYME
ncbi:hypothetical protein R54839_PPFHFPJH_00159 [Fructobacillus fructosus]|uniref:DUF3310 domain-containing protein n=1 Tax=Fructobacillus fructosus TaxID=1631 RepID=A0ABN9YIE1_9LACO|nr:hypothetical protein R54839_PPFHFPJH_00159 [Fructobacillus fructosus]